MESHLFFRDFNGKTALDYAYEKKYMQIVEFLFVKMVEFQAGFES